MLPRADIGIPPVGRAEAGKRLDAVADPRQEAFSRSMASLVGRQVQGDILARLNDGSYLVKVSNMAARMQLPPGTETGKAVPMTLLTVSPRPTFQVALPGQAGQLAQFEAEPAPPGAAAPYLNNAPDDALPGRTQAGAAQLAQARALVPATAADLAASTPALPGASAAAVTLSDTARVLSGVLGMAMAAPGGDTIVARSALVSGPAQPPEQVAAALRDAVGKSGLFYESHLSQWSNGARPLAELADEPQMQRGFASAADARGGSATDPAAAQLINLQLQTQEQARVAWQGQVWPGQDMRWEIRRDESERGAPQGDEPEAAPWQSALQLRFPLLGEIGAKLVLRGDQLHLQLDAGADAGPLLRAHAARLETAMAAAGAPLASFQVNAAKGASDE